MTKDIYGGSWLSKTLGLYSFLFAISGIICLVSNWKVGLEALGGSVVIGYLSYLFAGGKRNPALYQDAKKIGEDDSQL